MNSRLLLNLAKLSISFMLLPPLLLSCSGTNPPKPALKRKTIRRR
ncbi:hypothetical protein CM49_03858 [Paenibacillus sp. P1XP2]|nr:hypothetical protein CM49_03858 [Paenibacillus sp. P1XP2]